MNQLVLSMEKPKPRMSKTRTGTVTLLIVKGQITESVIGEGWIFCCQHGGLDYPCLVDSNGNQLDPNIYFLHSISIHLALASDRIH